MLGWFQIVYCMCPIAYVRYKIWKLKTRIPVRLHKDKDKNKFTLQTRGALLPLPTPSMHEGKQKGEEETHLSHYFQGLMLRTHRNLNTVMTLPSILLLLHSPAVSVGFTILGEIFACVTVFSPIIPSSWILPSMKAHHADRMIARFPVWVEDVCPLSANLLKAITTLSERQAWTQTQHTAGFC